MKSKTWKTLLLVTIIIIYTILLALTIDLIYSYKSKKQREIYVTVPPAYNSTDELIIAYYSQTSVFIDKDVLLNSNIIDESAKNEISTYYNLLEKEKSTTNDIILYYIYKEGKDLIYLKKINDTSYLNEKSIPVELYFNSNLNYRFSEIIEEFKTKFNIDLENTSWTNGSIDNKGVFIGFSINDNGIYIPYYYVIYEGEILIVNR